MADKQFLAVVLYVGVGGRANSETTFTVVSELCLLHALKQAYLQPFVLSVSISSTRGHGQRFVAPFARTESFYTPFYHLPLLCGTLPNSLVDLDELVKFKDNLNSHFSPADLLYA